ncbi:hypothetical protein WJT74_08525 [Sphingomicrobium sp. XHP0239]|uniref:hypothetical protein n=1 Tax=Sphingomicrobium maritimum TaxID=3133972 RepID=UPI0031CCB886
MGRIPLKRIQVGLTGLAFALALVLVGTAVTREEEPAANETEAAVAEADAPAEPLSEIGAAPGTPGEPEPQPVDPIPIPIDPTTEELIVAEPPRATVPATPAPRAPSEQPRR